MITSERFNEELKKKDNILIINKACSRFKHLIPPDDLQRCKLMSLWKALLDEHKYTRLKFTTLLFKKVKIECKNYLACTYRYNKKFISLVDDFKDKSVNHSELHEFINLLPLDIKIVIKQRFFDNLTLKEIGEANKYSYETARHKINKGIELLKEHYNCH